MLTRCLCLPTRRLYFAHFIIITTIISFFCIAFNFHGITKQRKKDHKIDGIQADIHAARMRTKPHTIYYTACMCMHRYRHGCLCVCVRVFQSILVLSLTFLTLCRLIVCLFIHLMRNGSKKEKKT